MIISVYTAFRSYQNSAITVPQQRTLHDIVIVRKQVEIYRQKRHSLPRTLRYLPPIEHGYVRPDENGVPVDWWKRPLQYWTDGTRYRIASYGYDGKSGGRGLDYDLSTDDLAAGDLQSWPRVPPQAIATFSQFATDRGLVYQPESRGLHGSGSMVLLTSILTGIVTFMLAFWTIGDAVPTRASMRANAFRLIVVLGMTWYVAMCIVALHIPSGH